ncbi:hemolysin III family protein [Nakamurella antarctica]|uniref:Hemolysin III family protein n=1 Tax=Nakamurella antarctica TaxID=1902245 RepID=A0A3G8ZJ57_9ACTN|nr:hemolysin III family protein [Nakamurella antarctica]AZI57389.1 hemolysin III family protein [Nakamurella antarctica]
MTDTRELAPAGLKPRARGWIHFYSAIVAVVVGIALVVVAASTDGTKAALACAVYAVTIIGLFSISATYHRHNWVSPRARTWMKRADHSMIFLFIAGTYTPFALLALPSTTGRWVLIVVWAGAVAGVVLKMGWPHSPRWVGVPVYIALGWVAIFIIPDLLKYAGVAPVVLMCAGGLFYTVGAILYAIRKPNPWPGVFGYHEFFHACVSLAALCHCVAVWIILLSN